MSTPAQAQRVAFYARISKKGDPVDQVADQLRRLHEHVADYMPEAEVVGVYQDRFTSAWDDKVKRPHWEALRESIRAGNVDRVMAVDQDRLSRHGGAEWVEFFERDCRKAGTVVHTIARGELDPNNRGDRLSGYVAADSSQSESQHKSDRLRAGSDRRRGLGLPRGGGVRPFGWARSDIAGGRVYLTEHPVEGPMVRGAVALLIRSGGVGLSAIVKRWNAPGQATPTGRNRKTKLPSRWTNASVKAVLTRPMNCGLVLHRGTLLSDPATGELIRGDWPALISEEDHDQVVALIESRRTGVRVDPRWLMTGLIKCHCGEGVRASINGRQQQVYRCGGPLPRVPVEGGKHVAVDIPMTDHKVITKVVSLLVALPPEMVPVKAETGAALRSLYERRSVAQSREANLVEAVAAGALSATQVAPVMAKVRAELAEVEEQQTQLLAGNAQSALLANAWQAVPRVGLQDPFRDALEVHATIRKGFEALPLAERRALVAGLVDVQVVPGRGPERVLVTPKVEVPEDTTDYGHDEDDQT